jgi:hypothetical protein
MEGYYKKRKGAIREGRALLKREGHFIEGRELL